MSREKIERCKPFVSVGLVILTLFLVVFCKIEVRRVGYAVLKLTRMEKVLIEENRVKMLVLARHTGPERVRRLAQRHRPLQAAEVGQIIQISGERIAF